MSVREEIEKEIGYVKAAFICSDNKDSMIKNGGILVGLLTALDLIDKERKE